ncbi:unnamed protein product, partial [Staurois parvus]
HTEVLHSDRAGVELSQGVRTGRAGGPVIRRTQQNTDCCMGPLCEFRIM